MKGHRPRERHGADGTSVSTPPRRWRKLPGHGAEAGAERVASVVRARSSRERPERRRHERLANENAADSTGSPSAVRRVGRRAGYRARKARTVFMARPSHEAGRNAFAAPAGNTS